MNNDTIKQLQRDTPEDIKIVLNTVFIILSFLAKVKEKQQKKEKRITISAYCTNR